MNPIRRKRIATSFLNGINKSIENKKIEELSSSIIKIKNNLQTEIKSLKNL